MSASDKAEAKRQRDEDNAERGAANDPWHRGGSAYASEPLPHQLYRFSDLKQRRIVESWAQLKKLVMRDGFPPGFILSPQIRAWRADDIERWLASRPTAQIEPRGMAKALKEGTAKPPRRRDASQAAEAADQR